MFEICVVYVLEDVECDGVVFDFFCVVLVQQVEYDGIGVGGIQFFCVEYLVVQIVEKVFKCGDDVQLLLQLEVCVVNFQVQWLFVKYFGEELVQVFGKGLGVDVVVFVVVCKYVVV